MPEIAPPQPILTQEQRRILSDWNDTRTEFPQVCVHELFERQVERNPEAVAVVYRGRRLSYGEVNGRANQVARCLRKLGVGAEIFVAVCVERSPEMVIALLGVWKAGGAYVPMDPGYPRERLAFMARDAGVKILLTEEKCRGLFSSSSGEDVQAVCMDTNWGEIAQESAANLEAGARPYNLAYVMYTSGSTGEPKGVMVQHDGLVNYLCWAMNAYAVEGGGAVPVHSSIAFDSTVASLYPPLLSGGQIELLPEGAGVQGLVAALGEGKNQGKVVVTPTHLEILNEVNGAAEMLRMTKVLVVAGERLLAERLTPWREFASETRLFNEYGPTEATVGCCSYEVRAEDPQNGAVPIGQPISNTQLYVLDDNLQPVTAGVVGELYIGGAGVARGYLNRPELTKECFLDDPFSAKIGARMYRTGDLVRYCRERTLEFVGRVDDQVKIRGCRIELGEIDAALARHPGVRACRVLAREDPSGIKELVAYVISMDNISPQAEGLRKFLGERLPDYMVPSYFVLLDSMPLTQNGKVDRAALPTPFYKNILAIREFVAPRTECEKKLAAIWKELLKVERVGIYDDLFDLGGNSLTAIRAMSRIQEAFGVVPSLQTLFSSATVAALADALAGLQEKRSPLDYAETTQQNEIENEPPFWWIGEGISAGRLSAEIGSNPPFISIGIGAEIMAQVSAPYRVEKIAAHLVSALRKKQPCGPYRLGGYCLTAAYAYEVARQLTAQGQKVGLLVLIEPLNPGQPAAVRFKTGWRRMLLRGRFRASELRRLEIKEFPAFTRNRWEGLQIFLRDALWRFRARSGMLNAPFRSSYLEKILFGAASSYEPKPLHCPTVFFRCKDWPVQSAGDPYFGWREWLIGPSETIELPGDHKGIFQDPNVQILSEKLRACLQDVQKLEPSSGEQTLDSFRARS